MFRFVNKKSKDSFWAAFSFFVPMENGPHYLGVKVKKDNNFLEILANTIMNVKEK